MGHSNLRVVMVAAVTVTWSFMLLTGGLAFAAERDPAAAEATPADTAALDPAAFNDALQGLTPEEQDAMRDALKDFSTGQISVAREVTGAAGNEQQGLTIGNGQPNPALGAPEIGGGQVLTAQEQAVMERVNSRANELAGQGLTHEQIDGKLKDEFKEEFSRAPAHEGFGQEGGTFTEGRSTELGRPDLGDARDATGQRELMERQGGMEHSREAVETHREQPEAREMMERPTYETPTTDRSHDRPASEQGGMEVH